MDKILSHIENMKQKPEHVRRRYAFFVSFAITLVIFTGWIGSYGLKTPSNFTGPSTNTAAAADAKIEGPVKAVISTAGGLMKDVKDVFFGTNRFQYSSESNIEIVPGNR